MKLPKEKIQLDGSLRIILQYIITGQTERLKQSEWKMRAIQAFLRDGARSYEYIRGIHFDDFDDVEEVQELIKMFENNTK